MKTFTRVCLSICLILAGIGMIACIAGFMMGFRYRDFYSLAKEGKFSYGLEDFKWDNDDSGWTGDDFDLAGDEADWIEQVYTFDAREIDRIDIEYEFGEVNIGPADSDVIEITMNYRSLWDTHRRELGCVLDGSTLKVEDNVEDSILKYKPWNNPIKAGYLTILIPESKYYKEFNLETGAAKVMVDADIKAEKIKFEVDAGEMAGSLGKNLNAEKELILEAGAGRIHLENNIVSDDLGVKCGVGEITLDTVKARNTEVDCGIGVISMTMGGRESEYDYFVESNIGEVNIGSSGYGGLGTSRSVTNNGTNTMEIKCGIGAVSISFEE